MANGPLDQAKPGKTRPDQANSIWIVQINNPCDHTYESRCFPVLGVTQTKLALLISTPCINFASVGNSEDVDWARTWRDELNLKMEKKSFLHLLLDRFFALAQIRAPHSIHALCRHAHHFKHNPVVSYFLIADLPLKK